MVFKHEREHTSQWAAIVSIAVFSPRVGPMPRLRAPEPLGVAPPSRVL